MRNASDYTVEVIMLVNIFLDKLDKTDKFDKEFIQIFKPQVKRYIEIIEDAYVYVKGIGVPSKKIRNLDGSRDKLKYLSGLASKSGNFSIWLHDM